MTRTLPLALLIAVPAVAAPLPDAERERLAFLQRWGTWTTRDGASSYHAAGERVRIRLSDGHHTLYDPLPTSPEVPHFLRRVVGDFTAEVRVTCPRQNRPNDGRDRWVAGGLVVHDGPMSYVIRRVEGRYKSSTPYILTQKTDDRRGVAVQAYYTNPVPVSTVIRLTRHAGGVTPSWSPDGVAWAVMPPVEVGWGQEIRVGVVAESTLGVPAEVTFDRYSLTQPKNGPEARP